MKFSVIKTGGKQYIVSVGDEIIVDKVTAEKDKEIELEKLAEGDFDSFDIELGTPLLKTKTKATVIETMKGDKLRVARFHAKTRYRKVTGFRPMLSRLKIIAL